MPKVSLTHQPAHSNPFHFSICLSRGAVSRIDEQLFCNRNPMVPSVIRFHPYDPWLAVADKEGCTYDSNFYVE